MLEIIPKLEDSVSTLVKAVLVSSQPGNDSALQDTVTSPVIYPTKLPERRHHLYKGLSLTLWH